MTRRISLIITIVGAALVVAVPAAWSDSQRLGTGNLAVSPEVFESTITRASNDRVGPGNLAVSPEVYQSTVLAKDGQDGVAYFKANEMATLAASGNSGGPIMSPDTLDRLNGGFSDPVIAQAPIMSPDTLDRLNGGFSDPVIAQAPSSTSSDRDIEWPQVGIGLGIGVLLLIGLFVALRGTRSRPLAH